MTQTHWVYSFDLKFAGDSDNYYDTEDDAKLAAQDEYIERCGTGDEHRERQSTEVYLSEVIKHEDDPNEIVRTVERMVHYSYERPDTAEHGTYWGKP